MTCNGQMLHASRVDTWEVIPAKKEKEFFFFLNTGDTPTFITKQ